MQLHVYAWGEPDAPRVVCLHGVTGHGRRFRKLAEERLSGYRVLAPDLRGHGRSGWDEPWTLDEHVGDLLETFTEPAAWIGHSFGGRLALEVIARRAELVERAVLIDPAIHVPPEFAEQYAALEREEKTFISVDGATARWAGLFHTPPEILEEEMREHLAADEDGRLRYRYSQPAAAAVHIELSRRPPPFAQLRVPTLLVVGAESKLVSAAEDERYRAALGDLLEVVVTPGGHSPLWDAFEETATAVERFLGRS
ncbi:MAG: alpha/beta fold hydrolase [Gaiellaceae bacterium]